MEVNVPAGGSARPLVLLPQQATVPLVRIPQVWRAPASTAIQRVAGCEPLGEGGGSEGEGGGQSCDQDTDVVHGGTDSETGGRQRG